MNRRTQLVIAAALLAAFAVRATDGINLIGVGPVQQGTAGAGVASAKDSTWLILNPAGLTDVGRQTDASFQYFKPVRTLRSTFNPGAGTQEDSSGFFIPALSTSLGCCDGDNGYIGLGLYGTSGMGVDYNQPRVAGMRDRMTELSIAKLTLTYARSLDNGLSIGAGPVFVLSRLKTDMFNGASSESGEWDTVGGAGAVIGLTQRVGDRLTLGASYISEQFMSEFDEYDSLFNDSLNLPQQITAGLAVQVLTNLEAVLDYQWVGWGELDTFGDQFGWENQHIVKAGLTWDATQALTLRSGFSHGNSPIGSEDVFANALFPAIMETHAAAGLSYALSEQMDLHLTYIHAFEETLTDSNSPAAGGGTQISMYQNSVTLGLSWTF